MKKMKKIFAGLLATTMVMSMTTVAFADGESLTTAGGEVVKTTVEKLYTVNGDTEVIAGTVFPEETLTFKSELSVNPDTDERPNLEVLPLTVRGLSNQILSFKLPQYKTVGLYTYKIKEDNVKTQGVSYTPSEIVVTVLVGYDYNDEYKNVTNSETGLLEKVGGADNHKLVVETIGVAQTSEGTKNDEFTNIYDLGSLEIGKTVTGNLGDTSKEFKVEVTLTTNQKVLSDISYLAKYNDTTYTAIEPDAWKYTGSVAENTLVGTVTVEVVVKNSETVYFYNIPVGVKWSVAEYDYTDIGTGIERANSKNGYDVASYSGNGKILDEKVTVKQVNEDLTYKDDEVEVIAFGDSIDSKVDQGGTKTIDNDKVMITNNKGTEVATGIILDSAPYILLLALACLGMFAVVRKKREDEI